MARRSLMTLDRVGSLPASFRPWIIRSAPTHASYSAKVGNWLFVQCAYFSMAASMLSVPALGAENGRNIEAKYVPWRLCHAGDDTTSCWYPVGRSVTFGLTPSCWNAVTSALLDWLPMSGYTALTCFCLATIASPVKSTEARGTVVFSTPVVPPACSNDFDALTAPTFDVPPTG